MWLLLAFIAVPLIEIALFIQIGGLIGLWPTLLVVLLTAFAGTALVRSQGLATLRTLQTRMNSLQDPSEPLAHGALILVAGILLLTPGFFTDAVGFALLIPQLRSAAVSALAARLKVYVAQQGQAAAPQDERHPGAPIIDTEYHEVDPDQTPPRPGARPSGWTQGPR